MPLEVLLIGLFPIIQQSNSLTLRSQVRIRNPVRNSSTENKYNFTQTMNILGQNKEQKRPDMIYPLDRQLTYDHCAEAPVAALCTSVLLSFA